ncbi:MAG: menaquinone biosynthesis decarboxylase [Anaerolineaceae bacterium]|nr:menaquinone biosynthesis decarboxylase [Anaerolineaceae bacterium]
MAYRNLQEFLQRLESAGQLQRIGVEVDAELEITEMADRQVKRGGPALLMENVRGSAFPLLINAFASRQRMAWALGVEDCREIAGRIRDLLTARPPEGLIDKIKGLGQLVELSQYAPKSVASGACQEVVLTGQGASLEALPILKCWPGDGGKFITLGAVFTPSRETGHQNSGVYRLQVYDARTTGMHIHAHHDGQRHYLQWQSAGQAMPAAVVLGGDPACVYAATAPTPPGMDEMLLAGFIRRKPVPMVRCKTIEVEVPAEAEIVIEGAVAPDERRTEGPFGDHTGYYSLADQYPVFHVSAITHRRNAVYPATVVGRPPMEDCFMGKATERIFLPLLQTIVPEVVDYDLPLFGVFHNFVFVAIRKTYPLQARKVMHALWGLGQMMLTKFIIVVDHDTNVHDADEVLWRVGNNVDPGRDVEIVAGPLDALDHAAPQPCAGTKMGIDATRKIPGEGQVRPWPEDIRMAERVVRRVTSRWKEYGFDDQLP